MESKLEIYQIVFFLYIITGAIHITYIVTFLYIICESFSYQTNRSVSTAQLGETKKNIQQTLLEMQNKDKDNQLTRT